MGRIEKTDRVIAQMPPADRKKRERCLRSVFWTAWYLGNGIGYKKLSMVLHNLMAMWWHKANAEGWKRMLCMITRDYFKTSLLGVSMVINEFLNDPHTTVLYIMHKEGEAVEKMSEVKAAFESKMMEKLFPDRYADEAWKKQPGAKWTSSEFTIPRYDRNGNPQPSGAPSVKCRGVTAGVTGGHYSLIVMDDPIKGDDEEAAAQLEAAKKVIRKLPFLLRDRTKDRIVVLGTLHEGGFYEPLMANPRWKRLILGAYCDDRFFAALKEVGISDNPAEKIAPEYIWGDPDRKIEGRVLPENRDHAWERGQPIFPEVETLESLDALKDEVGEDFEPQVLNIPKGTMRKRIKREDIVWYKEVRREVDWKGRKVMRPVAVDIDGVHIPRSMWRHMQVTWDPSGGAAEGKGDTFGIVVQSVIPTHGLVLVHRAIKGRNIDEYEQAKMAIRLAAEWGASEIRPEDASLQKMLLPFLRSEMSRMVSKGELEHMIPLNPYKRGSKGKYHFIMGTLLPFTRRHQVCFKADDREHNEAVDEVCSIRLIQTGTRAGRVAGESPAIGDALVGGSDRWHRIVSVQQDRTDQPPIERAIEERRKRQLRAAYDLEMYTVDENLMAI